MQTQIIQILLRMQNLWRLIQKMICLIPLQSGEAIMHPHQM